MNHKLSPVLKEAILKSNSLSNNKAKSILNKENNLIDANYIDDVSNDIANIFDKLLDEEYGE